MPAALFEAEQFAVEAHRFAVDRFELIDAAHQGRLAGARRPEHGDDLPLVHAHTHVVEGLVVPESLAHVRDLDDGHFVDALRLHDQARCLIRGHCSSFPVVAGCAVRVVPRPKWASTRRCTSVSTVTTTRYQITATISIGTTSYVRL